MSHFGSLSLDLDNEWSYLKIHGDAAWTDYPSYLDVVVPRVLEFLARRDLKITFFVVGRDAAAPRNREALAQIARAGHELGNHSFSHEPWIAQASERDAYDELARAHEAIAQSTGQAPVGFRGPGFASSPQLLNALIRSGYRYDASDLATFIGPLARWYYFRQSQLDAAQRLERATLFGTFSDGLRPNRAHVKYAPAGSIVEIPVTTMPIVRLPIHCSYLHYIDAFSPVAADRYFALAMSLCRAAGVRPSLLLHPLDFLGGDDVASLRFFPGMSRPSSEKLASIARFLDIYQKSLEIVPMREHARRTQALAAA
ncbi:MAG TPA: polysaccharide deacetylase family protein [Candidatus Baltobacteraceae bacterium]|jgi:peptidoglycan/xylan/chitin deacetylase (PgdA/CDA1 family)